MQKRKHTIFLENLDFEFDAESCFCLYNIFLDIVHNTSRSAGLLDWDERCVLFSRIMTNLASWNSLVNFSALRCIVDYKGFDIFLDHSEACRSADLSNWDERSSVNNLFCDWLEISIKEKLFWPSNENLFPKKDISCDQFIWYHENS